MQVRLVSDPWSEPCDWFVLGLFEEDQKAWRDGFGQALGWESWSDDGQWSNALTRLADLKAWTGSLGEFTPLVGLATPFDKGVPASLGFGKREKFTVATAYSAGVALAKKLGNKFDGLVVVCIPAFGSGSLPNNLDFADVVSAMTQGFLVGGQGSDLKKSEPSPRGVRQLAWASLLGRDRESDVETALNRAVIVGEAINLARNLINLPPADKAPSVLADKAKEVALSVGAEVKIWLKDELQALKFGGLLGVSAGSEQSPAFVKIELLQGGADAPTYALVGKGVTFDSGGLSLKPTASMETMKCDMGGAAAVLAAIVAAGRLKLPVNLIGYLALTENMTGGAAMKLGDVLSIHNGKTVEVLNTDAEGRLILADALSYAAAETTKPAAMIDLATLTGACVVALGSKIAGLFSNNDALANQVSRASQTAGERLWQLPLDDDFKDLLKSQVADLKNVGNKWGGACTAAKFLEQFVADVPWAHLDIAGPSWADSDSSTQDSGATGFGVRTLVALAESWARC